MDSKPHHQNPNKVWTAGLIGGAFVMEGLLKGKSVAVVALAAGCCLLITVGVLVLHHRRRIKVERSPRY